MLKSLWIGIRESVSPCERLSADFIKHSRRLRQLRLTFERRTNDWSAAAAAAQFFFLDRSVFSRQCAARGHFTVFSAKLRITTVSLPAAAKLKYRPKRRNDRPALAK